MADGRPEESRTCEGQHGRSTEDAREGRGGHTGCSQDFHPSPEQQKWLSGFKDLGQFPFLPGPDSDSRQPPAPGICHSPAQHASLYPS